MTPPGWRSSWHHPPKSSGRILRSERRSVHASCDSVNMPEQHGPAEFGEILNSPEHPLIVGGQAVNVWAEYFAPRNAQLAAQHPFVSKDADIFGDRALAQKLAAFSGWEIKFFHEPRTIAVAVLVKRRGQKGALTVEVLREVRGLSRKEL